MALGVAKAALLSSFVIIVGWHVCDGSPFHLSCGAVVAGKGRFHVDVRDNTGSVCFDMEPAGSASGRRA